MKRLIYTSTIDSYYAGARAGTITEDTPLDPRIERRNLYARAKAASERHLLKMHRERGLPVVIVRPGIVIGRGRQPHALGYRDVVARIGLPDLGSGRNPLPLVLVEDVARGLIAASEVPGSRANRSTLSTIPVSAHRNISTKLIALAVSESNAMPLLS